MTNSVRPPFIGSGHTRRSAHSNVVRWVHDVLRHEIQSGVFADNVLPSEEALMQRYDVSRGTVRRVVDLLRQQGLIERLRGAGTFILTPVTVQHGVEVSRDIAQDLNHDGQRVVIFKLHSDRVPAPPFVADRLALSVGEEVVILETITFLDGFPLSTRTAFMPASVFGCLLADPETDLNRSPYELIAEATGEDPGETSLAVSASLATDALAELLGLPPGAPLLDTHRVVYSQDGAPLEYSISHARGDRLALHTTMEARTAYARADQPES